ncbi:MAG TPA: hypothetical protein VIG41_01415, partial [Micrococcaceae bacterium]
MSGSNELHNGAVAAPDGQLDAFAAPDDRLDPGAAAFQHHRGRNYRRASIIVGIIGLVVFGFGAGLAAFMMARRAESFGVKATAGKVLAVLDIIGGIIVIAVFSAHR